MNENEEKKLFFLSSGGYQGCQYVGQVAERASKGGVQYENVQGKNE